MNEQAHPTPDARKAAASLLRRLSAPRRFKFADHLARAALEGGEADLGDTEDLIKEIRLLRARLAGSDLLEQQLVLAELELQAKSTAIIQALKSLWRSHLALTADAFRKPVVATKVTPEVPAQTVVDVGSPAPRKRARRGSKSALIRERLVTLLEENGPTHRGALLSSLTEEGLVGTEAKPVNRLATVLSENKHLFGTHGRGVYFVRPSEPTERATPTGPSRASPSGAEHPLS
jgi:hypothetical protein